MFANDLVDEYVVVNSSDDRTSMIVRELAEAHEIKVKLIRIPRRDFIAARVTTLKKPYCRFLMSLDANMVLFEYVIKTIKDLIETLNSKRRYLVLYWEVPQGKRHSTLSPRETQERP